VTIVARSRLPIMRAGPNESISPGGVADQPVMVILARGEVRSSWQHAACWRLCEDSVERYRRVAVLGSTPGSAGRRDEHRLVESIVSGIASG
jgi:hypothetical protein